jgi:hypothetical protein
MNSLKEQNISDNHLNYINSISPIAWVDINMTGR